jgi:hypothetical protein
MHQNGHQLKTQSRGTTAQDISDKSALSRSSARKPKRRPLAVGIFLGLGVNLLLYHKSRSIGNSTLAVLLGSPWLKVYRDTLLHVRSHDCSGDPPHCGSFGISNLRHHPAPRGVQYKRKQYLDFQRSSLFLLFFP